MQISRIELNGFKSFARPETFDFPQDGITAVVGPNGCGKSNIIDAVRWVLGERSRKELRMKTSEIWVEGIVEVSSVAEGKVACIREKVMDYLTAGAVDEMCGKGDFAAGLTVGHLLNFAVSSCREGVDGAN